MKNIFTICLFSLMILNGWAQSPEKMSYQAVIRNSSNALVSNSAIGMRISILQMSPTGNAVYVETQTPTTNANGLASIEIGGGTNVLGNFSTIEWADGPYFVKTETDPLGGTNYTITGTSQLLSVPYALYAATAGNNTPGPQGPSGTNGQSAYQVWLSLGNLGTESDFINSLVGPQGPSGTNGQSAYQVWLSLGNLGTESDFINSLVGPPGPIGLTGAPGPQGAGGFQHQIGEQYGGGVIFHLWKDNNGVEHGLVVALNDQSTAERYSNVTNTLIGTSAQSRQNGLTNSNAIVLQIGHTTSAAQLCIDLVSGGFNDWYLPAIDELLLIWDNRYDVEKALSSINGATNLSWFNYYWSSTESSSTSSWQRHFTYSASNYATPISKATQIYVRAIRSF